MTFETVFKKYLPLEMIEKSVKTGNEYAIPYPEVLEAVQIATSKEIAILGVETFTVLGESLLCESFSGYNFELGEDWISFDRANNDQALQEIAEAGHHAGVRFILTIASKSE
jgi:hypothetical protein